jgi:hypothetical protein
MINSNGLRKIGIQAAILLFLIIISYIYFFPQLEGKVLEQSDIQHHIGMSKELADYRKATGQEAIWTNSMFGGMPGYLISVIYSGNIFNTINTWFKMLFHPAAMLILYLIGFYILLLILRTDKWLSIVGAIAFGFSSYFLIIIAAGHNTKAYAIGFLMPVMAGVIYAYQRNPWKGGLLFSVALAFEILASHIQITYYGLLTMFIFVVFEFVSAYKNKALPSFIRATIVLFAGTVLAVMVNFSSLYTTYEYSKHSIRGPSELTNNAANKTTGLDKDYVVQWSEGIDETLTLLIPNYMGGAHPQNPGPDSQSLKIMQEKGVQNARQNLQGIYTYRGDKPATAGPVYLGAIIVFLFVLSLFIVKGNFKWWLLTATLVSFVLSWGKNIMWLTSFLLDYLPMYNKFRTPEMALVIAEITVPLLAFIGLQKILSGEIERKEFMKAFKWALIITGGITLLFAAVPGIAGDFSSPVDSQLQYPGWLMEGLLADRKALLRNDSIRSFFFIALAAGTIYAWLIQKIKLNSFLIILGILILADLWVIDRRYLNTSNFVTKREAENPFPTTPVDKEILKDKDLSYRVLPLQNPWQDARTSYYHKNVGGYHPAKMRRYQEIIDFQFMPEIQTMVQNLQKGMNPDSVFMQTPALNMLNTRYFIYALEQPPIKNQNALGNAWFVDNFRLVNNADEEIKALTGLNPSALAIIDKRFSPMIEGKKFSKDTSGTIKLIDYKPNYLKYEVNAATDQLAVFSEVYYENGWSAFIDGKKASYFRTDYILRGMIIPSGQHIVEFKFHPASYYTGEKISLASSVLLLLIIAGLVFYQFKYGKEEKAAVEKPEISRPLQVKNAKKSK